jgi:hypothetical protein
MSCNMPETQCHTNLMFNGFNKAVGGWMCLLGGHIDKNLVNYGSNAVELSNKISGKLLFDKIIPNT